jgi:hypothetical protein
MGNENRDYLSREHVSQKNVARKFMVHLWEDKNIIQFTIVSHNFPLV